MTGDLFQLAVFETGFLAAITLAAALAMRGRVQWKWLVAIPVLAFVEKLIAFEAGAGTFGDWIGGRYNWEGKLIGSAFWLGLILLLFRRDLAAIGLTLRQDGRFTRLGLAIAIFTAVATIAFNALYFPGTKSEPAIDMAYQATMPSIEEELWFRGLMLAMLIKGLTPNANAKATNRALWLAAIVTSLQFWAVHSIGTDGAWGFSFDPWFNPVAGILGSLWVAVRLGTGSLLLPVVLHTLANTIGYFV